MADLIPGPQVPAWNSVSIADEQVREGWSWDSVQLERGSELAQ